MFQFDRRQHVAKPKMGLCCFKKRWNYVYSFNNKYVFMMPFSRLPIYSIGLYYGIYYRQNGFWDRDELCQFGNQTVSFKFWGVCNMEYHVCFVGKSRVTFQIWDSYSLCSFSFHFYLYLCLYLLFPPVQKIGSTYQRSQIPLQAHNLLDGVIESHVNFKN